MEEFCGGQVCLGTLPSLGLGLPRAVWCGPWQPLRWPTALTASWAADGGRFTYNHLAQFQRNVCLDPPMRWDSVCYSKDTPLPTRRALYSRSQEEAEFELKPVPQDFLLTWSWTAASTLSHS